MSDGKFEYFEDMKDYAFESTHASNHSKIIGGLTILFLVSASGDMEAKELYSYEVSSDKYELIDYNPVLTDCVMNSRTVWRIERDKRQSEKREKIFRNLKETLATNGWSNMNAAQRKLADDLLDEISILPIKESFMEFDGRSNTLFSVLSLPQDLRISFTRYLTEDGDLDLYFSVKGENVLLYSGSLPSDEFVKATLEVIAEINRQA